MWFGSVQKISSSTRRRAMIGHATTWDATPWDTNKWDDATILDGVPQGPAALS